MKKATSQISNIQGPVLILGASGFVGANLFLALNSERSDVFGTSSTPNPWRLSDMNQENVIVTNLLIDYERDQLINNIKPRTIFNCAAYGAYSFQNDISLIYETNFTLVVNLLETLLKYKITAFVHAGTSSEYGSNAAAPSETIGLTPNSHYAVSKVAAANAIYYFGTEKDVPCVNLRLYSVYGPYEDSSRLIPQVVIQASNGRLPEFVDPAISRDFVFIDDVVQAFIDTAIKIQDIEHGRAFNVGCGHMTKIGDIADMSKEIFSLKDEPRFTLPQRQWDVSNWYSNSKMIEEKLGWQAKTDLKEGLIKTKLWYENLSIEESSLYLDSTKKNLILERQYSVSAVIACYKDEQAIPIMHERLTECFQKLGIDYEIIFVNDCSPDSSEEIIREITKSDRRVSGITHSRNFGSQSAFLSGMNMASKQSVVLLDGDLQDPPELISEFVEKWKEGYDVVYGTRIKRETPWYMSLLYRLFYRLFDKFSFIQIPHDAGDFSLMDAKVVQHLLEFPERDIFLRGVRAFIGFKQVGVDYVRPSRQFGKSTNSILGNIGWAKKGLFSFSYTPLNILTAVSLILFVGTVFLSIFNIGTKVFFPEIAPKGITTLLLVSLFFGSLTLLSISLLGEYVSRIFEEVKRRPSYIRQSIIEDGQIRRI